MKSSAKLLLRWCGGKSELVKTIAPAILEHISETGGTYIEPFLGGGAVALHLGLPKMLLGDSIGPLMNFYRVVRDMPAELAWATSALAVRGVDEAAYYSIRDLRPQDELTQAARMLYLNRLCFNGLYRVNKAGNFNVPYANDAYRQSMVRRSSRDAITSLFPHKGKLEHASRALAGAQLWHGDFEPLIDRAESGDAVYADSPYDSTYDSYTAQGFTREDQERLAGALYRAQQRGAWVLASNADTEYVRWLYSEWCELLPTKEKRSINADGRGRGRVPCVLIAAR